MLIPWNLIRFHFVISLFLRYLNVDSAGFQVGQGYACRGPEITVVHGDANPDGCYQLATLRFFSANTLILAMGKIDQFVDCFALVSRV